MSFSLQAFIPSADELDLATRLLELNSWNRTESLSVDTAIGIFKQNGLTFKQLREIWSIADKDGSGQLSREELAIVIRLMGWVQAGETLDESLLKQVGPIPKIKGITDIVTPTKKEPEFPPLTVVAPKKKEPEFPPLTVVAPKKKEPEFPPLTVVAPKKKEPEFPPLTVQNALDMKQTFMDANPTNGTLRKPKVMEIYMRFKANLPFETLFRIMQIVRAEKNESGDVGFKGFAIGMHLIQNLHIFPISSAPITVPPETHDTLDAIEKTLVIADPVPTSMTIQLPAIDADIKTLMNHLDEDRTIPGFMVNKFQSKYKIKPVELAQILRKADSGVKAPFSPAWLTLVERLVREEIKTNVSQDQRSPSPPPSYHTSRADLGSSISQPEGSSRPDSVLEGFTFVPPSPLSSPTKAHPPEYKALAATPVQASEPNPSSHPPISTSDQSFLNNFQEQIGRLTSQLENVVREQTATQDDLQRTVKSLQDENVQLKLREVEMQGELARKEVELDEAEKLMELLRFEVLEKDATIEELGEEMKLVVDDSEALKKTVDAQNTQIASLLDLVGSLESTIKDLHLNPAQNDLRLGFLRASARASQAETTKAISEADNLRQTVSKQEQEIKELRDLLEERQCSSPSALSMNKYLTTLREDHEGLKAQVKQMQALLLQRILPSNVPNLLEAEEDTTLVAASASSPLLVQITSPSSSKQITSGVINASEPYETHRQPSEIDSHLEYILTLLREDLQNKRYMGGNVVQQLISEYGLNAQFLDEVCRLVGVNDDWKMVDVVIDRVRQAIVGGRGRSDISSEYIPLSRSTSRLRFSEDRYSPSSSSSLSEEDDDDSEDDEEKLKPPFSRLSTINLTPMTNGHPPSRTIIKSSFLAKMSPTPIHLRSVQHT